MHNITFAHPWLLLGLLLVPLLIAYYIWRYRKQEAALQHSDIDIFAGIHKTLRVRLRWLPYALRVVAVGAIVIALARPQSQLSRQQMKVEGIDIVMAMDISGSMLAEDFRPNRLEAAKQVAAEFIDGRKSDRMSLVVFAGEAFTQVPLTVDHHVLLGQLEKIKSGLVSDGTGIRRDRKPADIKIEVVMGSGGRGYFVFSLGGDRQVLQIKDADCDLSEIMVEKMRPDKYPSPYCVGRHVDTQVGACLGELLVPAK